MRRNRDERRAQDWLESQGHTEIRDLSAENADPPDFVVDGRVGVEVRRLAWMTDAAAGENLAAEELETPLRGTLSEALEKAGEPPGGYGVLVSCDLLATSLPETKKRAKRQVEQAVVEYTHRLNRDLQAGRPPQRWRTERKGRLVLHFFPFSSSQPGRFTLADVEAATDLRGWVVKDSIDNINRCIAEKTGKIEGIVDRYPEWWLVLMDHDVFTPGRGDEDWEPIRQGLVETKPWSRIVVLSWVHPSTHVDVI